VGVIAGRLHDGCLEIIGFLEIPGYSGDKRNPVGVDFDRPY